jgi:hypothetical protein
MTARVAEVNKALELAGHAERLRRGRGYYYFTGGGAAAWHTSGVCVAHADELTVAQWLAERDRMAGAEDRRVGR